MSDQTHAIELKDLVRRYGRTDAVSGLNLRVRPGRCYGFFGRNGAGKTTTIKCLLNLLRPTSGEARVFGLDPARREVEVKSRLAYVPDAVAFYPWMTVRDTLDYFASFRARWNGAIEAQLLRQFRLDERQKTGHLSKGQRVLATTALLGSFASAEERQLGTHEWQLLMPISARTQFGVKVGVAFALVSVSISITSSFTTG